MPLATAMLALKLAEEILRADEVIVENPPRGMEELRNQGIAHRVPHARTLLATGHDVVGTQHCQLLRHDWLLHAEGFLQFLDVLFTIHQELENPNANGVSERPEERGFERLKFVGGDFSHISSILLTRAIDSYCGTLSKRRTPWACQRRRM